MRSIRSAHGGTLALVVTCILIIAIVGLGLFYVMRMIGGERELDYAARSGNLNVAKQAIMKPGIALTADEDKQFGVFKDNQASDLVNLRVYNRLVGQALLVACNASADGNQTGKDNAETLIRMLQSDTGIGAKLKNALADRGRGTNDFFAALGLSNNTRMLGGANGATANINQVAWCEARTDDIGATNLLLKDPRTTGDTAGFNINQLMPSHVNNDLSLGTPIAFPGEIRTPTDLNRGYLRGYQEINVPGIGVPIIGVPTQPGAQPHLLSATEFSAGLGKFGDADKRVPPNAFEFGASKQEGGADATANTGLNAVAFSRALIGSLGYEKTPSIPRGYIVINNGAGVTHTGHTFPGDGVFQNELAGDGIQVDQGTGIFTANNSDIAGWQDHNQNAPSHPTDDSCPYYQQHKDGMYKMDGNDRSHAATSQELHQIRGSGIQCNDTNSTGRPDGSPTVCSPYLDAFLDRYGGTPQGPDSDATNLTGIESAKADLINRFPRCGPINLSNANPSNPNETKHTGLRFFPAAMGANAEWPGGPGADPSVRAKISRDGTMAELFDMVNSGSGTALNNFLKQRMRQIKPGASNAELDAVLSRTVPMQANAFYIYMDPNTGNLVMNDTRPTWVDVADRPDGTAIGYERRDGNGNPGHVESTEQGPGWVNSIHENGIHQQMYLCQNGTVKSHEKVTLTPSSGYNNILGEINFEQWAEANGAQYCCTD